MHALLGRLDMGIRHSRHEFHVEILLIEINGFFGDMAAKSHVIKFL